MSDQKKKDDQRKQAEAQQAKYGAPPEQTSKTAQGNPGSHKGR